MNNVFVFNFHRISDEYSPSYPPMPIKVFEKVIKFLMQNFFIIPQQALIFDKNISKVSKPLLIITFDDAYLDFVQYALPILIKYNIPVSQHVITSCAENGKSFWTQQLNKTIETYFQQKKDIIIPTLNIQARLKSAKDVERLALQVYLQLLPRTDKQDIISDLSKDMQVLHTPMMTWKDLISLPKNIVTIGSHTHNHLNLSILSKDEAKKEMKDSFNLIEKNMGISPLSIAYPNGQYTIETNEIAQEIGYKIGYSCEGKVNSISQNFLFHRLNLYNQEYWKNKVKIYSKLLQS